jgi:hypothetical protein
MAADEIDRDFPKQREILDGVASSDPAVIFVEGNVEHPVQAVRDLPMPADRFRQDFWLRCTAGQEVADFGFSLAGPVDAADGFHGQNAFQARPVAERFQRHGVWAHEHAAPDQSAMTIIEFIMDRPVSGRAAEAGCFAKLLDGAVFLPLIRLERYEIISPFLKDFGSDCPLAPSSSIPLASPAEPFAASAHRIQRDDRTLMSSTSSNSGIAVISLDLSPTWRWPRISWRSVPSAGFHRLRRWNLGQLRPCTDNVKRPLLAAAINGSADRLPVDRHDLAIQGRPKRVRPRLEARLEARLETPGIDQHKHASEGGVGRDAIGQREEFAQPVDLAAAVQRDVFSTLGSRDHGADRDHQDINQPVLDLAAAARIFQGREFFHQVPHRYAGLPIPRRLLEPHQIPCRQIPR